jgi:leader peptidase (prepilin peptidase)/N-methyltransferase
MSVNELLLLVPAWQLIAFAAVFGALWGSFANVVIVRWPKEQSVLRPASHCVACGTPIRFYDNVPIVSYLVLRGRCRSCKERFSPRYMVVELALALLSVGVLRMTLLADPPTPLIGVGEYFVWFAFVFGLVTAGLIDLETYLLPDAVTLPGIVIGLAANSFLLELGWKESLIAAAGGFAVIRLLFVDGYRLITGKPGMGEGDAKLVAMIGAFLGVRGVMFALFAGALQGFVVGIVMVARRRREGGAGDPVFEEEKIEDGADAETLPDTRLRKARVPFGPFLALGAIEYFFIGEWLLSAYLGGAEWLLGW